MNWENKSRLKRLGDKHNLEALDEHWIKPIKYSIEGEEAINLAKLQLKDRFPKGVIRKLAKKFKDIESMTPQEMVAQLNEEELDELLDQTSKFNPGEQFAHIHLVLLHGIGDHNLENGDGKPEEVTEDFVQRICEDKALALEMSGVIEDHNRPLPKGSASKSETPPNGSAEASSSKKVNSSPMAVSPAT